MTTIDAATYHARQTEKEFQAVVLREARLLGWLDVHFPSMVANPAGFPDLILLRGGVCLFVELKTARGRMGKRQLEWAVDLEAAGFPVHIWTPDMWDTVIQPTLEGYPDANLGPQTRATHENGPSIVAQSKRRPVGVE